MIFPRVLITLHTYVCKIEKWVGPEFQECVKSHVNTLTRNRRFNDFKFQP